MVRRLKQRDKEQAQRIASQQSSIQVGGLLTRLLIARMIIMVSSPMTGMPWQALNEDVRKRDRVIHKLSQIIAHQKTALELNKVPAM